MSLKNKLLALSLCLVIATALPLCYYYYHNFYYARRLISAIDNNDDKGVYDLLTTEKGNINSFSHLNSFWHVAITDKAVYTPLQKACVNGNLSIIHILLAHGADINLTGDDIGQERFSPVMLAVELESSNSLDIVKLLAEKGANLKYSGAGELAITLAATKQSNDAIPILEYLESKGQSINGIYPRGNLLHYVCDDGTSELLKYLILTKELDVNVVDDDGETPLIIFARQSFNYPDRKEDLLLLLEKGADKRVKNNEGKTAYDYAIERNRPEYAELLKLE
jgi:ankyrin repeat protein